jgi:RNA-directed DNA polymerase
MKPGNAGGAKGSREMDVEMSKQAEDPSATVPQAQQAEAEHPVWRCAKPCVWTVRMLTTLVKGVEGGKWFRLFDKVFAERNLLAALQQVAANDGAPGVDHVTTTEFVRQLPDSIWELADRIKSGRLEPQAIRRVYIPKPGSTEKRPLGIPTVRDRVVQAAIVNVIEPIFERDFAEQSYGFRHGRSCQAALRRVDELLHAGYTHVVDADLKGYFDSIPHDRLMERLKEKIADGQVLSLIEKFLKAAILDGLSQWTPEEGAPQGAVLSPLLSNVYLDPLDHLLAREGFQMVRYADDFVILCRTAEEASRALALVQAWVSENGLTLHPTKTRIVDVTTDGFDFLGYHFCTTRHSGLCRWARDKSVRKLKETLRPKTKRNSGRSLDCIIRDVNRVLRGWFGYFRDSRPWVFTKLDKWLRRRLRTILRKRLKLRGISKGRGDCTRWPNAFFARQGLYNLVAAHANACQPSRR